MASQPRSKRKQLDRADRRAANAAPDRATDYPSTDLPRIGEVVRRLRTQQHLSIGQLANAAGLSPSFLRSLERGETDISVGRLARIASVFGHDIASLLGYSSDTVRPRIIGPEARLDMNRGEGVEFTAIRIPGTHLELMIATMAPHSHFDDVVTHAGNDVLFVAEGSLVLVVDNNEYQLAEGDCAVWPSSHPHTIRNDSGRRARAIGMATETVY